MPTPRITTTEPTIVAAPSTNFSLNPKLLAGGVTVLATIAVAAAAVVVKRNLKVELVSVKPTKV